MPIRTMKSWAACVLALGAVDATAQSCAPPVPFQYSFQSRATLTLSAPLPGDPCGLGVALQAAAGPTASGFLHYRRATPLTSVRYGFRLDTGALANSTNLQSTQIFAAVSPTVAGTTPPLSDLLEVFVGGAPLGLTFVAAKSGGLLQTNTVLTQSLNTVRVEIDVGSGTNGVVRYWINHAFTDPPDGVIDNGGAGLDNAAWVGVIGAELGLSTASNAFRSNQATHVVTFDQIESNDDVLFWSSFYDDVQRQEAP